MLLLHYRARNGRRHFGHRRDRLLGFPRIRTGDRGAASPGSWPACFSSTCATFPNGTLTFLVSRFREGPFLLFLYCQKFLSKYSGYSFSQHVVQKSLPPLCAASRTGPLRVVAGRARPTFGISSRSVQPAALTLRTRCFGGVVQQGVPRTLFCAGEEGCRATGPRSHTTLPSFHKNF